jgi:hypothetical protein
VASQAFAASVEENTVVTRSVYVWLTSASTMTAPYDLIGEAGKVTAVH